MGGRCPGDFSCRSPAFGKLFRRHYNASEPAAGIPGGGRSPQSRAAAQSTMSCSRQSARRLRKKNSRAGDRHRALALSSQFGHTEIVRMLLDARVGTTLLGAIRTRPPCIRPLWRDIAMLFDCSSSVACGWLKDAIWQGTPAEWAGHEGRDEIEKFLRSREQEGDVRCWPNSAGLSVAAGRRLSGAQRS